MIRFMKIARDSYVLYKNNVRITPIPLTKEELHQKILELDISERDQEFIDKHYNHEV